MMTVDQIAILLIIVMTFILFIWGRIRYDIVSIIALCTIYIADELLGGKESNLILDGSNLFTGFAHPAVITVALVLIISRALRNSGVVDLISGLSFKRIQWRSHCQGECEDESSVVNCYT